MLCAALFLAGCSTSKAPEAIDPSGSLFSSTQPGATTTASTQTTVPSPLNTVLTPTSSLAPDVEDALDRAAEDKTAPSDLALLLPTLEKTQEALASTAFSLTRDEKTMSLQTLATGQLPGALGGWVREVSASNGSQVLRFEAQVFTTQADATAAATSFRARYTDAGVTPQLVFPSGTLGSVELTTSFMASSGDLTCRGVALAAVDRFVFLTYVRQRSCDVSPSPVSAAFVRYSADAARSILAQLP
jgi:hypothetical protein